LRSSQAEAIQYNRINGKNYVFAIAIGEKQSSTVVSTKETSHLYAFYWQHCWIATALSGFAMTLKKLLLQQ